MQYRAILDVLRLPHTHTHTKRTYEHMFKCAGNRTYVRFRLHIYRSNICSIEHTFGLDFKSLSRTYIRFRLHLYLYVHIAQIAI